MKKTFFLFVFVTLSVAEGSFCFSQENFCKQSPSSVLGEGRKGEVLLADSLRSDTIDILKTTINLQITDFAGKTIFDIFESDSLKNANGVACYNLATCYIRNDGNDKFEFIPLPTEAQMFPVFGIIIDDFNSDNFPDVLLAGNSFSEAVDMGYCDAGSGLLLTGDGFGKFTPVPVAQCGFFVAHDVKNISQIYIKNLNRKLILVANNNDILQTFEVNKIK